MLSAYDIQWVRDTLGLSQEKMAQLLGISYATVNRCEQKNGTTSPTGLVLDVYRALHKALMRLNDKERKQLSSNDIRLRILGPDQYDRGQTLYYIFRAAYGD